MSGSPRIALVIDLRGFTADKFSAVRCRINAACRLTSSSMVDIGFPFAILRTLLSNFALVLPAMSASLSSILLPSSISFRNDLLSNALFSASRARRATLAPYLSPSLRNRR